MNMKIKSWVYRLLALAVVCFISGCKVLSIG